jgi:hypothetical protein
MAQTEGIKSAAGHVIELVTQDVTNRTDFTLIGEPFSEFSGIRE